jgi:uncharacterized membrane protein
MLGNPKWFKRRKYCGWGVTPANWQGWVYCLGMLSSLILAGMLTSWVGLQENQQIVILLSILAFFLLDSLLILSKIDKDERESSHEAIAERNASWLMVSILVLSILYQVIRSTSHGELSFDPFLLLTLLGGILAKALTNIYIRDK